MQQGDYERAEVLFTEALASFERWFGKNYPRIAEIINDLANLLCHPHNKTGYVIMFSLLQQFHISAIYYRTQSNQTGIHSRDAFHGGGSAPEQQFSPFGRTPRFGRVFDARQPYKKRKKMHLSLRC